jgi:hypothetical protein
MSGKNSPLPRHIFLVCFVCLFAVGCDSLRQTDSSTDATPTADLSFFDQIVTFESVFPDPAERARHRIHPPEMVRGQRVYGFSLMMQPGMNEHRHYSVVSVAWEPARTETKPGMFIDGFGPGGGSGGFVARTHDGLYDVRVGWGNLLPEAVTMPNVETRQLAEEMVRRYERYVQKSNHSLSSEN